MMGGRNTGRKFTLCQPCGGLVGCVGGLVLVQCETRGPIRRRSNGDSRKCCQEGHLCHSKTSWF